jgi:hypothetical protein
MMTPTPTTPDAIFAGYPVARWEFVLQAAETDCRELYPDSAFRGLVGHTWRHVDSEVA